MILKTHRWGPQKPNEVVCVHGIAQHGGIFAELGERLVAAGHSVLAVDLRGHGDSGKEPPWNTETHVDDVLETLDALGVERASWVGHSFGGRVVSALAARAPERTNALALLDPALEVDPDQALRSAEIERLDWSFATVEGAINALLSSEAMVDPPQDVVREYVQRDIRKGPDGRYRFRFSPSAVVTAWSEVTLPAVPVAVVPTLLVVATVSLASVGTKKERFREALGDLFTDVVVPNGHNVLWEAPEETISAIEDFVGGAG
jgi:pimeloyl-ACP methyl ester carboxylesterase